MERFTNNPDLRRKSGIYKLYYGKHSYIGSSKDLGARFAHHLSSLKNNSHYNNFLQRVYNKHGLYYEIIEFCDNYIEREEFYIRTLSPNMNVEQNPITREKTEPTKIKLSLANKGKRLGSSNTAAKKIYQYDLEGNFINSFDTLKEASKAINCSLSNISAAVTGYSKSAGGYQWSFIKKNKISKIAKNKLRYIKYTKVSQFSKSGNLIKEWSSINELAEFLKVTIQAIHQAAKKDRPCRGFKIKLN